ncbi:MAG: hypothetical protein J7501_00620 [Bdellovibrio sp.]|nr:hypothetical protein [Bdellovibrio sp.]
MKKTDLASYALFLFTAIAGASLGLYQNTSVESSDFSSTSPSQGPASVNDYKTLPCPNKAQYKDIQRRLHLTLPDKAQGCSTEITAGVGKLLLLMDKTRLQAPPNWLPTIQAELTKPFEYLVKQVDKMYFDLSETNALAKNLGDRTIVLGGGMLMEDPLDSIATLIHEARHSEKTANIHVECIGGDIPRTRGGCDAAFDVGEHAGAYSYNVIFQSALAIFGVGLNSADREFLMSSALGGLGTRFNELPASLSAHSDMLITLDKNNKLQILHPFTKDLLPLEISFKDHSELVERIEFSVRNSGILLFTNKKRLLTWTPRSGMGPLYKSIFNNDIKVSEAARIALPNESGRSRFVAQDTNGKMYWVKFSPEILDYILAPFPYMETDSAKQNHTIWKRFFLASYGDTAYLNNQGQVYLSGHQLDRQTFILREDMQDPSGWVNGTGGLTYDNLYLVNGRGEAKVATVTLQEIDDIHSTQTYSFKPIEFQVPESVKYLQGLQTEVQLTKNGDLYLKGYNTNDFKVFAGHDIRDFTFAQVSTFDTSVAPTKIDTHQFEKTCHIQKSVRDPWFGKGIGIDSEQQLVFAGNKATPCLIRHELPPVYDVELKPDPSNKGMGLSVETAAGTQWIAPYSY